MIQREPGDKVRPGFSFMFRSHLNEAERLRGLSGIGFTSEIRSVDKRLVEVIFVYRSLTQFEG